MNNPHIGIVQSGENYSRKLLMTVDLMLVCQEDGKVFVKKNRWGVQGVTYPGVNTAIQIAMFERKYRWLFRFSYN
jgi:hypothetical protein